MQGKSSAEWVRQRNSVMVLRALRRHGPLAHTELSDFTTLSSATISAITGDLERAQILVKTEQQSAGGRGRPRVAFAQRRDCGYLIVVIISSDAVHYSLVDYAGTLIDRFSESRSRDGTGLDRFTDAIRAGLHRIATRSQIAREDVLVISISSKGLVDSLEPVLRWSPIFGDEQIDFGALLREDWQAKIIVGNETLLVVDAVAQREEEVEGPNFESVMALSLGHSIGLGIVRRTAHGDREASAPNFGHMLHEANGGLCRCGSRGCIEAYAGFYAILRNAFAVPLDTIPAKFVPLAELDKIAASARQGNRRNRFAFHQAGLVLGNGLSRVLSLYERMPIVLTGPGTRFFDLLREGMEEGLRQSQMVRMGGLPDIRLMADEQSLAFEGHMRRALDVIDNDIVRLRPGSDLELKEKAG